MSDMFPELKEAVERISVDTLICEGEAIVFDEDTNIQFDPYDSSSINFYNLDVLGGISTDKNHFYKNIVH